MMNMKEKVVELINIISLAAALFCGFIWFIVFGWYISLILKDKEKDKPYR